MLVPIFYLVFHFTRRRWAVPIHCGRNLAEQGAMRGWARLRVVHLMLAVWAWSFAYARPRARA